MFYKTGFLLSITEEKVWTTRMPLSADRKVDPTTIFEILAKLGEGSYGSVFKALDKRDGQIVAVKVLDVDNEDTAELQKEIKILQDCDSPYIVGYRGSFEHDGKMWIVMEYCGAGSVCDLMAICEKTLSEHQIAVIMKMALCGLEYLHSKKKIHRDIKSGNILLNHDGDCKLADFGVSAELTTTMSKRKTVIGTPYWMAPEVLQSLEYDGKADMWSLGITAIELACGEPPHSNVHPMRAIFMIPTSEPPKLPNSHKWSKEFNDFVRLCLQKNPKRRPTATWLLKNHAFITKLKPDAKNVIASLVEECMDEIDEYREGMDEEDEESESESGSNNNTIDDSTMIRKNDATDTSSSFASDTMVDTSDVDNSTMVQHRHSNTMVDTHAEEKKNMTFYFRDNTPLNCDMNSTLTVLESSLKTLKASQAMELTSLKEFYDEKKQQAQILLTSKA